MVDPSFADLLRFFRLRAALTQDELATRTGVGVRTIRDVERGRARSPQRRTVELLSAGLGLSEDEAASLGRARERAAAFADTPCALPQTIADLTGREPELALLTAAAPTGTLRVAVVHGAPGIGKTTLVVHAAHHLADRFPDGSFYVEMHGVDDVPLPPAEAAHRLMLAIGVSADAIPTDAEHRLARYRSVLSERKVLVLLDNPATEAQLRPLLAHSPGSMVLVSSRSTLAGLDADVRVELGLLRQDQAVDLLRAIVGADRVATDPGAAGRVADLCGGVPLAVRIAGNRLASRPTWPLTRLATELADERHRLSALAVGDVQVRAAFEMSYRQLDADAAAMFRGLSAVPGPDTGVELAGIVAGRSAETAERVLEELVDASLLGPGRSPDRYAFHDLLRVFAMERLEHDEGADEAERRRLATGEWLLTTAISAALRFNPDPPPGAVPARFQDVPATAAWLARETGNWRGALRGAARAGRHRLVLDLATAMHWYSDTRGGGSLWLEVFTAGERAATALGSVRDQAVMLNFLCWTAITQLGWTGQGLELHHRAMEAAKASGDLVEQGWAEYYRSAIERLGDNLPEALRRVDAAGALFRDAGHETGEHLALSYRGVLLLRSERYEEAASTHRAEITHHRAVVAPGADDQNLGLKLYRLAESLLSLGEFDEALTALDEAEDLLHDARASTTLSYVRYLRGRALVQRGEDTAARTCLLDALVGLRHPLTEVKILVVLADLHDTLDDPGRARECRIRALASAAGDETPSVRLIRRDLRHALGFAQEDSDVA